MTSDAPEDGSLLLGERSVLELIATGATLPVVLDALCTLIDEQSGLTSAIYVIDSDGRQLRFAAGPHVPDAWRRLTTSYPLSPTLSACGSAVHLRHSVVVESIAASPLFPADWRAVAAEVHIASAWSTPFFSREPRGRVLGTFAVFDRALAPPTTERLRLVERATRLASIIVEWNEAEAALRESERRFSTAFYLNPASMSIARLSDRRLMYVNDEFVADFGYSRAEAIGKTSIELGLWVDPAQGETVWREMKAHGGLHSAEFKARTKSGEIIDVLYWNERIQILGEDCVLAISCDITDRKRAERALAENERRGRTVLETLPVGVAVVDASNTIVMINAASKRIWGGDLVASGTERYAQTKGWWRDTGKPVAPEDWASFRAVTRGETSLGEVIEIEAFNGARKVIMNSAAPIRDGDGRITGAVIINEDISARDAAERGLRDSLAQLRALSGRLMRAQDDERRRIAQMLHETTAQDLAALKMLLARLSRTVAASIPDADRSALTESIELADRSITGIRTLSYLLHPPFLDETGLLSALRWYASGFAERSGIAVDLDLPPSFERLDQDVETALFRVVQEALINVHRHAASERALIRLRRDDEGLTLEVADRGRGMPPALLEQLPARGGAIGVGVAGMRERLQQLGGTLDIESAEGGTTVRARVPLLPEPA